MSDLGTTPVRLYAYVTCQAAATGASMYRIPGDHNVATGRAYFAGAQLEIGTRASKLCVTTTTAKTCKYGLRGGGMGDLSTDAVNHIWPFLQVAGAVGVIVVTGYTGFQLARRADDGPVQGAHLGVHGGE